jgi:DNA-binding transcriptional LysR family regulator
MKDSASALPWGAFAGGKGNRQHGGLSGAATSLGVNHSAVARRLAVIEEVLDVSLFDRRRTGYRSTGAGAEMILRSERVDQEIFGVARHVAVDAQRHTDGPRIATSNAPLYDFATPIIADFQCRNPKRRVEVVVADSSVNLSSGEFDVALRASLTTPDLRITAMS